MQCLCSVSVVNYDFNNLIFKLLSLIMQCFSKKCVRNIRIRSHSPPIIQRQQFLVVNFTKKLKYYKFPLYFRLYLLLLQLHLLAEAPQGVSGRVQSLWKRAFIWRLSLTTRNSRKVTINSQRARQRWMSTVGILYPVVFCCTYIIGVCMAITRCGLLYTLCVGFCVVRLDCWAMREASSCGMGNRQDSHAFLYVLTER